MTSASEQTSAHEEGWVRFQRFDCLSGYIDRWTGDCINNPNNKTKSSLQLNAFAVYYRLNGGTWFHSSNFVSNAISQIFELRELYCSEAVFEHICKPYKIYV